MLRQRDLEIRIERVPGHPAPRPEWEQYRTPAPIAAAALFMAYAAGDIQGRTVGDLGCGTGMFLVGAGLLRAERLVGIDIDPRAVETARAVLADLGLDADIVAGPVESFKESCDTIVMNPPFGAQFAQRGIDTRFVEVALDWAPRVYALHMVETQPHLLALGRRLGARVEHLTTYDFSIPHQFRFHTKAKVLVRVGLFRYSRMGHS